MKKIIVAAFVLGTSAVGWSASPSIQQVYPNGSAGVKMPKWYINNADQTPVWTDAQKTALISSTALTNSDFIQVGLTQDDVALATMTFASANYDATNNLVTGNFDTDTFRSTLCSKLLVLQMLVNVQEELSATQLLGIADVIVLLKIQRLKSLKEFLTRKYNAL